MSPSQILLILVATLALAASLLVVWAPRLGRASYALSLHFAPASLVPLTLGLLPLFGTAYSQFTLPIAVACLCLSAPGLLLTLAQLGDEHTARRTEVIIALLALLGPALSIAWLFHLLTADRAVLHSRTAIQFGPWRFAIGTYLLVVSVSLFVQAERVLRALRDRELWKLKFPLIGIAIVALAWLLIATQVLLFGVLEASSFSVVWFSTLLASLLVLLGWRRLLTGVELRLSHSAVYGSLTLAAVGVYLLLTSLAASWLHSLGGVGTDAPALLLLFALAVLAAVLLSSEARGKLFGWVRRNVFRGRYDYRTFWLEADERIRDNVDPVDSAQALADLVRRGLGAVDVSVWLTDPRNSDLRLIARLGAPDLEADAVRHGLVDALRGSSVAPANRVEEPQLRDLLQQANAVIYLPLRSGDVSVGLLTAGSDQSGNEFDRDAYDFLGVLGLHAAREFHKRELLARQIKTKQAEAFRDFATFMMHDLKNFASTLSLIARNASRHGANPEFLSDAFSSVHVTAEKMRRLCNSLYAFAASEEARYDLLELTDLVAETIDEIRPGFAGEIVTEWTEAVAVRADHEAIRGVVRNLLMNAIEACGGSGTLRVQVTGEREWGVARFEDDGPGIPREFLEHKLFEPFRTTKSDGLGIGLFQAKTVIEAHGGSIEVESEEGHGTQVTFRLPRTSVDVVRSEEEASDSSSGGEV